MNEIKRLFDLFFDICLLRKGPQDVPSSPWLLRILLTSYFLLGAGMSLFEFSLPRALVLSALDVVLLFGLTLFALHLSSKRARLVQTLEGLFGVGVVLNIFAFPVIAAIHLQGEGTSPGLMLSLSYIALLFWSLTATGHVYRHALSTSLPIGVLIAIAYMILSINLAQILLVQTH